MSARPSGGRRGTRYLSLWAAVCFAGFVAADCTSAQEVNRPAAPPPQASAPSSQPAPSGAPPGGHVEPGITQVNCTSCGSGLLGGHPGGPAGCGAGGCGAHCYPGRFCDHECGTHQDNVIGRIWHNFYECLCCPDPCYEPRWVAAANAAFFADQVRPKTQMRLRWDAWRNGLFRDRAEFLHARGDGNGQGPQINSARYDLDHFRYYMEGATERFGLFVEIPYRNLDPENEPERFESGFSDMNVGTKSMLLDCELMQITFQFTTYIPIGQAGKGLGTGHVSLEPSLLMALKLGPDTYFQGQAAYWIPIGGDQDYAGDIFHYHLSLNHVLWRPLTGVKILGTAEFNGWSVLDGAFTLPTAAGLVAADARELILTAGPGLRLDICDRVDFGVGTAFAITSQKWAEQMYRAEFRWRF